MDTFIIIFSISIVSVGLLVLSYQLGYMAGFNEGSRKFDKEFIGLKAALYGKLYKNKTEIQG